MFGDIGLPELIVILVVLLIFFGPSRLGDLGSSLGKGIKGFRRSLKEMDEIEVEPSKEEGKQIKVDNLETSDKTAKKEDAK
jgi:sec-independent protein translocase protein TatA